MLRSCRLGNAEAYRTKPNTISQYRPIISDIPSRYYNLLQLNKRSTYISSYCCTDWCAPVFPIKWPVDQDQWFSVYRSDPPRWSWVIVQGSPGGFRRAKYKTTLKRGKHDSSWCKHQPELSWGWEVSYTVCSYIYWKVVCCVKPQFPEKFLNGCLFQQSCVWKSTGLYKPVGAGRY